MLSPLASKLCQYVQLSKADQKWLAKTLGHPRTVAARCDIINEGDEPSGVNVVIEGWACRYKQFSDGRRQITSLMLPGDLCDPHVFLLDRMDHAIGAITPVVIARLPGSAMRELNIRSPRIDQALQREALATASIQREWTASLGCRTGVERLAHLFCELHARLAAVGLVTGTTVPMPLRQVDLGHALGQTNVHINRTLKELRGAGLVTLKSRHLIVHDLDSLAQVAHFDPTYLHFTAETNRPRPLLRVGAG